MSASNRIRRRASLVVRDHGHGSFVTAKWRDEGRQVERTLGRAWLVRAGDPQAKPGGRTIGSWCERRGRAPEGYLTPDTAREELPAVMAAWLAERAQHPRRGDRVTFTQAAWAWFDERGAVAGWKPTTRRGYEVMLRAPDAESKRRGTKPRARIMSAFGHRDVSTITEEDVRTWMRGLDHDPALSSRSVNSHRLVVSMVLAYAADRGWRAGNPVDRVPKRREPDAAELVVYSAEQVQALSRHAIDPTIGGAVLAAAMTGLRMGELLELRWRDVHFGESVIHVQRSYAAGLGVTTPKGRRGRSVPLADQVATVLARLGQRERWLGRNDLVFASPLGNHIDPTTLRNAYMTARDRLLAEDPDAPVLTFRGLRHCFGSRCASAGIDVVTIQRWMGHASIRTTERYMHHAPSAQDAQRLSEAFASAEQTTTGLPAAA